MTVAVVAALAISTNASADPPPRKLRRVWTGLVYGMTAVFHPSGSDVCASSAWTCAQSDGPRYPAPGSPGQPPVANVRSGLNGSGGVIFGGIFDYAVTDGLLIGARFDFNLRAVNANATTLAWFPLIAETRATWVLGPHPLTTSGLRPYVLFGVGLADFSTRVGTPIIVHDANGAESVSAWRTNGPGFVTTGLGVRLGTDQFALLVAPFKLTAPFGAGEALVYSPELLVESAY